MEKRNLIKLFLIILLALPISCISKTPGSFTIKGNIQGIPDGSKMLLTPGGTHKTEKAIAETIIKDGQFTFSSSIEEPRQFHITVDGYYGSCSLVIDNENVSVSAKASLSTNGKNKIYVFEDIKITGSKLNDEYLEKKSPRKSLDSLYKAYHDNNDIILKAIDKARNEKNKSALDSLYKTAEWKKFAADEKNFFDTVETITNSIIMSNKDSWWGPFLMMDMMSYFTGEQKTLYEAFSQQAKNSYYGKLVKEELYPKGFVGTKSPSFNVTENGKIIPASTLFKGKKYILIDFWASWCNPCRKEIPNLKAQYAKYAGKGLQIISISIDKKKADWEKALKEEQLKWPNYLDQNGIADLFKVKLIPAIFLLDANGKVIGEQLRGESLSQKLDELFK